MSTHLIGVGFAVRVQARTYKALTHDEGSTSVAAVNKTLRGVTVIVGVGWISPAKVVDAFIVEVSLFLTQLAVTERHFPRLGKDEATLPTL